MMTSATPRTVRATADDLFALAVEGGVCGIGDELRSLPVDLSRCVGGASTSAVLVVCDSGPVAVALPTDPAAFCTLALASGLLATLPDFVLEGTDVALPFSLPLPLPLAAEAAAAAASLFLKPVEDAIFTDAMVLFSFSALSWWSI